MAFAECAARMFTATSVLKNAPDCSGIYAISNAREWIFIGEATDIRARLLEHLRERGTPLMGRNPTGFTFEICAAGGRRSRHAQLVREFEPYCNRGSFS